MKIETIYNDLVEIMENDMDFEKALKLKEKLQEEIRKSGALKTNSKSRYNALARLEKRNDKMSRNNLKGYGVKDNKYWFTDSYMYAVLKDNCNFEKGNDAFPIEGLSNIDNRLELEKLYITIEDLSYYVKAKEFYKNEYFENITFDYKLIKDSIDIIGNKDIDIYTNQDRTFIIFENKDKERVVLLSCRKH